MKLLHSIILVSTTTALTAFSTKTATIYYAVYLGSGAERNPSNYAYTSVQPSHVYNTLFKTLNWFRVIDPNSDNTITLTEFVDSFEQYDVVSDADDLLKDENADISGQLDLRNK